MDTNTRVGAATLIVIVIIIAIIFAIVHAYAPSGSSAKPVATALYVCNEGKTINTSFYQGRSTPSPSPDRPPVPGGSVALKLSDGRSLMLAQTISADGVRYANADESFVFWSKGNGALVLENNQEKSYIGCIVVAPEPAGQSLSQVYANSGDGFSIRYPAGFTADAAYHYQELGPGKDISGVRFTIAPSVAAGTNLSNDSYISVEEIPQAKTCSAMLFLDKGVTARTVTEGEIDYSVASSTGAGAGNRYEETVYALSGTNPCIAVRYFIHYGVIENYPPGAVQAFDSAALLAEFDTIRHTLTTL